MHDSAQTALKEKVREVQFPGYLICVRLFDLSMNVFMTGGIEVKMKG